MAAQQPAPMPPSGAFATTGIVAAAPRALPSAMPAIPLPQTVRPIPPSVIQRTVMQQPAAAEPRAADAENVNPQIQLNPPGPERLFRLETEAAWKERMRQEALERVPPERIVFPDEPILSKEPYMPRAFPPLTEVVEPHYVVYGRLYFQQRNFERYGWDLGFITPFVCAGKFFWDVAWLPYHAGTEPLRKWDTSAGQCLPGDPVPLMIYPPRLSLTGLLAEAGTIVTLFAVFPGP